MKLSAEVNQRKENMNPLDLAGYIVKHCLNTNQEISNLQLQKILYFVQLQSLMNADDFSVAIMPEAEFEAWKFGPVIKDVYYAYSINAGLPIYKVSDGCSMIDNVPKYVDKVVDHSLTLDPWELVKISHREGGAWRKTYIPGLKLTIPNDEIIADSHSLKVSLI